MDAYHSRPVVSLVATLLVVTILACAIGPSEAPQEIPPTWTPVVSEAGGSTTPETNQIEPGREIEEPTASLTHSPSSPKIDKWSLWVDGPHLRGANIYQRRVYPELDGPEFMGPDPLGPPYTQESFDRLAALGANLVNISHPGLFSESPPYALDEEVQHNLDQTLDMIARADMYAVISFRTGPGRAEFSVCCLEDAGDWYDESYLNDAVWQDLEAQEAWAAMWRHTAERYRDNPIVAGYDLMVEPNANEVWMDVWDQEEFYANYGGTPYDWNQLYPRITAAIREVDPDTPIIVGGMAYSAVDWLPYLEVTDDPRTVYAAHQYAPFQYTHQGPDSLEFTYPGVFDTNWDDVDDQFNRAWLEELLSTVDDFVSTHGVPVTINEFGLMRWQPGGTEFMDDQMALFEEHGINYALWAWETSWDPFAEEVHAFNFRFGPDPDNLADVTSSDLMDVITQYWGKNSVRPSSLENGSTAPNPPQKTSEPTPPESGLADVSNWLYLIDVNLEPEIVDQIAASGYDMLVLDFIPSEKENTDYPMAEVIDQLHNAPHPKLVMAYIDTGQAEAYRTYWQPGWGIGDPEWIVGADPDGWEGNFPVAYWYDEWQEIWLDEEGYLSAILDAGFDGVYLDWVEAYSDENVIAFAEAEGVDPRQEMIWWVEDIAAYARARRPGFFVIAQNAAELAEDDDYLAVIDAIAQEQIWFDGGADNDPPGDCPLPRTDAEVDTQAYRNSLSPLCRQQYDDYPDSTLHVSSEEYLRYLTAARDKGELIFSVDYALEPENISWVYETSRGLGFVPFVGNRALDRYVEPAP
jgi:cysteinyl-tRNA synthetase